MVNNCANPQCAKPLHYLREGRIFVFEIQERPAGNGEKKGYHLEHYWLCGSCSQKFVVEQNAGMGVRLVPRYSVGKPVVAEKPAERPAPAALAS